MHKFKEVEGCGLSALQYAIASSNGALIDFINKHDVSCFDEAIIGYGSYFQMALAYNSAEIIKLVSLYSDYDQELANLISTNQIDMLERVVAYDDREIVYEKDQLDELVSSLGNNTEHDI